MRYCPKCQTPADEKQSPACPQCGETLVPMDQLSEEELDRPVVLKYCADISEAEVLKTALAAQGIEALIEDEPLMAAATGWDGTGGATDTRVLVSLRDAEAALELIRSKEAGELALSDEDMPEEQNLPPDDEDGDADQSNA